MKLKIAKYCRHQEVYRLSGVLFNGKNITYKYNTDGIRTQKTVNGVTTNYVLAGDNVISESDGTNTIYYLYNAAGSIVSMNLNGNDYYYVKDAQGDIIGIIDSTGKQIVSYTYDTWGKVVSFNLKAKVRYKQKRHQMDKRIFRF